LRICLEKNVESGNTGFENFQLEHKAAPEIDFDEISLKIKFLGKKLNYPLIIEGMTGGTEEAKEINRELGKISQEYGIGFGVGSQRAAIEDESLEKTYKVRDVAPDVFLIANLGAVQLNYGYSLKECKKAVEMIDADALALHLNPLQEVIQPEGNKNFSNLIEKINDIAENLKKPVIVKETGCGISYDVAKRLKVAAIDVSGLGGTSFGLIEGYRSDKKISEISKLFSKWGIPTSLAIKEVSKLNIPIIGSGGIRNGLDAAKALALGAHCVAMVLPILKSLEENGKEGVREFLERFFLELKIAMFLTGSKSIDELKGKITEGEIGGERGGEKKIKSKI
jgi:isopentenyl-diphosphate delta-isomerase